MIRGLALVVAASAALHAADDRRTVTIDFPLPDGAARFAGDICRYDAPAFDGTITAETGWNDVQIEIRMSNGSTEQTSVLSLRRIGPEQSRRAYKDVLWMIEKGIRSCAGISATLKFVKGESDDAREARLAAEQAAREKAAAEREATAAKQERDRKRKAAAVAAKQKAEDEADRKRRAEILAAERALCAEVYRKTANKKLADVTVEEDGQIRACRARGLYY